ncbi:aminotransferase class I/II-fold pyridoxal phosphate-dependent enzyme [Fonticella tunisiensis]|uniref:Cystathionine beta-lyase family protein involved in aluminum resistance n=1 Tax=Fonticella tunisiensis TaxID=1096341 RepID=A0A4R7KQM1_9CLOT|nr:methionine gamma-lyase family protein [Fonticella tunisiensis]TDT61531.1 cystathionine beta-lyase family protein involved in aluminum resistance [Fonticella tunisiensis]
MLDITNKYLIENFNIRSEILELSEKALQDIASTFNNIDNIKEFNQIKVLKAMQEEKLSDAHFTNSTGYGYGDIGRDTLERVYARIFNAEDALVRPQIVSGTHAITLALFGNLRPGDTLLSITGKPYDTLLQVIGIEGENTGSLKEYGVDYKQIDLNEDGKIDIDAVQKLISQDSSIRMIEIQRSTGYGWRPSLSISDIENAIKEIKKIREDIICFVDNCYGEFIDTREPIEVGADIVAGSLIKNIGGGIAPTGGYVVGKEKYVRQAAFRLTAPGLGKECGSTYGIVRLMFQGLFMAPHITAEALKSAIFCSRLMELSGYEVSPKYYENRSDIIQAIKFNNPKDLINFCKGIQKGSPVDSFVECEPWDMPGYTDQVIMAAGAFVQGSSIELSADAPIRPPYIAYLQGGLTFEHAKIGILIGLSNVLNNKE